MSDVLERLVKMAAGMAVAKTKLQDSYLETDDVDLKRKINLKLDEIFDIEDSILKERLRVEAQEAAGALDVIDLKPLDLIRVAVAGVYGGLPALGITLGRVILEQILGDQDGGDGDGKPKPSAPSGAEILKIAKRHIGQPYDFVNVEYANPNWKGAFDCAEYASYCAWRAYGIMYGARYMSGSEPSGKNVEAWTGHWRTDALGKGKVVSVDEALRTPGAFVLRFPADGKMGHIAISLGDGDTLYEAHSKKRGVIEGIARGRTWNVGVLLPGVDYGGGIEVPVGDKVYRYVEPTVYDETVEQIQERLSELGFLSEKEIDGEFGPVTRDAVVVFQRREGLLVDGEVGRETGEALGLGELWKDVEDRDGGDGVPKPSELSTSKKFRDLKDEYRRLYAQSGFRSGWKSKINVAVDRILLNRHRYEAVGSQLGSIPWYFIAAIHNMESTLDFNAHLHNGDPLTGKTRHVPKGRPEHAPRHGSSYTWEESAIDALKLKKLDAPSRWSLPHMLHRLEAYNGWGYRSRKVPTAYLWSGTTIYDKGKFVADRVWDENARSAQVGCAAIFKALEERSAISISIDV